MKSELPSKTHIMIAYCSYIQCHAGWCYVSLSATSPEVKVSSLAVLILGYEIWTWLSLLGIILFSLCYVGIYRYRKRNGGYKHVVRTIATYS